MIELVLRRNGRLVCWLLRGGIPTCSTPVNLCSFDVRGVNPGCSQHVGHQFVGGMTRRPCKVVEMKSAMPSSFPVLQCVNPCLRWYPLLRDQPIHLLPQTYPPPWLIDPPGCHLELPPGTQQTWIHSRSLHWILFQAICHVIRKGIIIGLYGFVISPCLKPIRKLVVVACESYAVNHNDQVTIQVLMPSSSRCGVDMKNLHACVVCCLNTFPRSKPSCRMGVHAYSTKTKQIRAQSHRSAMSGAWLRCSAYWPTSY